MAIDFVQSGNRLLGDSKYAVYSDKIGNTYYYRVIPTQNASAIISLFKMNSGDEEKILFIGICLATNYLYIGDSIGNVYEVDKNVFNDSMTFEELSKFIATNVWEKSKFPS